MNTDLEQQVRDTLAGRAALVRRAPTWDDPASSRTTAPFSPRRRARWLPVAAAAAAVIAVGSGVAAWQAGDTDTHNESGGGGSTTCAATLPPAWSAARSSAPFTVLGVEAAPEAVPSGGGLVASTPASDHSDHIVLVAPDGIATTLATVPARRLAGTIDADGNLVVISSAPKIPADNPDQPIDDIAVVDTVTGTTRHVLGQAPMPSGWIVTGHGAVIQDGIVYWGAQPSRLDQSRGIVIRYDVADRRYRVLDHIATYPDVEHDRRGVAWPGRAIRAADVPSVVPPIFDRRGRYAALLVSDRDDYAWTIQGGNPLDVHWADRSGDERTFLVNPVGDSRFPPLVDGVSGPFVFMGLAGHGADTYVLDTRTGALASTGDDDYTVLDANNAFVRENRTTEHRVDPAKLPALHC